MRIPPEKIDEVRNASDVVDIIGSTVKLRKRGKNYLGLCPFHVEKTPSFNVSADRQMYHCFGCGKGGNVFTFIMETEKVSFVEAVRSLAEKAGITLPTSSSQFDRDAASEQEQLYEACKVAARFFYHAMTETAEGKQALQYFRSQRGFTDETIRTFGLGYSPNSWDALLKHAKEKGFGEESLEKAGLVRRNEEKGSHYDYFRGRAMFPIFSVTGRAVGFGARKIREDDPIQGKYINSPETSIYNKSRTLYGLSQAKEAIRETDNVIIVEGYADLISVFQAGIKNIVASSGTALTQEQIQLVARYTKNITIVYDADSAGSKATLRGVDLILAADLDVKVVQLPEGEDPDSYVRKHGGKSFQDLVGKSISFIDFISKAFERQGKLDTPEGQAQAVRVIVRSIARMSDELKRNFYIKDVASKYGIYESTLHRELEKIEKREIHPQYQKVNRGIEPKKNTFEIPNFKKLRLPTEEKIILQAMLRGGNEVSKLVLQNIMPDQITNPLANQTMSLLRNLLDENKAIDPMKLVDTLESEEMRQFISSLVLSPFPKMYNDGHRKFEEANPMDIAIETIYTLRINFLEKLLENHRSEMKDRASKGEDLTIFSEKTRLINQELHRLRSTNRRPIKEVDDSNQE